jgi:hypothetical protein
VIRPRMVRLVDPEPASARQTDEGQAAPIWIVRRPLDGDAVAFERVYGVSYEDDRRIAEADSRASVSAKPGCW